MPHPSIPRSVLIATLLLWIGGQAFARGPEPVVRLPLERFGYLALPARTAVTGAAASTVHFIDATHLLLTFSIRSLLARLPDEPPDDADRNVAALLLELPSGKVLARTEWRTHDHRPYIWALGHGNFLLRIRNELTVFSPLASLNAGRSAFLRSPFLNSQRRIGVVALSPEADLLTVESLPPAPPRTASPVFLGDQAQPNENEDVQSNFYRIRTAESPGTDPAPPVAVAAGAVRSQGFIALPVDSDGYLYATPESPNTWDFDFYTHAGKKLELAPFDSSCLPRPFFVSRSEFIAFGCRGSASSISLGGFNLKGEHMWIQNLSNGMRLPYVATAPSAGRYAISRVLFADTPADPSNVMPEEISGQEVTVTQTWSGQDIFKLQATPVQRDGQNFDLAADGLSIAVLRDGNLEIYPLPALTGKDREAIGLAQRLAPEKSDAIIRLAHASKPIPAAKPGVVTVDPNRVPTPQPALADPESTPPRKPPSLYAPGETPQKQ